MSVRHIGVGLGGRIDAAAAGLSSAKATDAGGRNFGVGSAARAGGVAS